MYSIFNSSRIERLESDKKREINRDGKNDQSDQRKSDERKGQGG